LRDLRLLHCSNCSNGGKLPCGAIIAIVEKYCKRGTNFITVDNLCYQLKREKIGKKTLDEIRADDKPANTVKKSTHCTVDSPLTDEVVADSTDDEDTVENITEDDVEDSNEEKEKTSSESTSKKSGRPRGMTIQNKKAKAELIAQSITEAAVALDKAQQRCYESGRKSLPNNTLTNIISAIEEKNQLEKGTLKHETIRWRLKHGNLDGLHPLCISTLFLIESNIVEYCLLRVTRFFTFRLNYPVY
jgi:hypothetical protein